MEFVPFVIKYWYLFVALLAISGMLVGSEVYRRMRGIATISPTRALQLINNDDAVIVDVRDSGEYREGHIPDARNITVKELPNRLGELNKFKERPIITYCATGNRSTSASAVLKKNGFATVYSLQGGLNAWKTANLPTRKK